MKLFIYLLILSFELSYSYINQFNHWHCIDFINNINKKKPYSFNIGELPLVSWFDNSENPYTTINICSHMGSKLDEGQIKNSRVRNR